MRLRIRKIARIEQDTGYISTFHGFCVSVLQGMSWAIPNASWCWATATSTPCLPSSTRSAVLTLRHMTYAHARELIEIRKNKGEPKYYEALIALPLEGLRKQYLDAKEPFDMIFYGYLYMQKKCFGLDYNATLSTSPCTSFARIPTSAESGKSASATSWWTSFRTSTSSSIAC